MSRDKEDFRAVWVERHTGRSLTEFQAAAVNLLCDAMRRGPYDFAGTFERAVWEFGLGCRFVVHGYLSTFDVDGLTRLVLGAHDRAIRVEVEGAGPRYMAITMHPRARDGERQGARHPCIESVIMRDRDALPYDVAHPSPVGRVVTLEYLRNVYSIISTLAKNAKHCFGVDFGTLNETALVTTKLLPPKPENPGHWLTEKP